MLKRANENYDVLHCIKREKSKFQYNSPEFTNTNTTVSKNRKLQIFQRNQKGDYIYESNRNCKKN